VIRGDGWLALALEAERPDRPFAADRMRQGFQLNYLFAVNRSRIISMKVVVTGGSGFIGSNLAGELVKKHDVTVIDNLSTGRIGESRLHS